MPTLLVISVSIVALGLGILAGLFIHKKIVEAKNLKAKSEAEIILKDAQTKAETLKKEAELEAKEKQLKMTNQLEDEIKTRKQEVLGLEKRLLTKEENLDKKVESLEAKEQEVMRQFKQLDQKQEALKTSEAKYGQMLDEAKQKLEQVAGLTADEARKKLIDDITEQAKAEAVQKVRQIEEDAKNEADKKGRRIMTQAIERMSGEWIAEKAITVVTLPNDEMKGRIIGREGRNIRTIEQMTGVDLIVDETPNAVILSTYNPIRREVARIVLERLIQDGRIHPTRIEEMVEKVNREIDQQVKEAGEAAAFELGVHGIHPEMIKYLGMLKFRTSYAQNVLTHSIEAGYLCGIMAAELKMNEKLARRAGLLHDIGKAVSHEVEGSHAIIGADLAKRYGEDPRVVHAIAAHHEDVPQETALAHLVDAADALSGARPGARSEVLESYIKRVEDLEKIATSFGGVHKVYAIQAGREIRVMVENEKITDEKAYLLSKDIARKIEDELTYPGQIKVTVIRELRAVDYAK